MERERKIKIIQGWVEQNGKWVTRDEKMAAVLAHSKKIEGGYVLFNGQWITIDEKIRILCPPEQPKQEQRQSPQVINITHTYNIHEDKRTINEDHRNIHQDNRTNHEHKHVHIDPMTAAQMQGANLTNDSPLGPQEIHYDEQGNPLRTGGAKKDVRYVNSDPVPPKLEDRQKRPPPQT
jgi:hypothetical protein